MRSNTHRVLALVRQLFDNRRRESSAADQISSALKLQPGSANSVSNRQGCCIDRIGRDDRRTGFYVSIMPPYLPWHTALVYLSGAAEKLLGVMLLLFRRAEQLAAWGAIALIIAVTPANIQMAIHPELYPDYSQAALWARLALQGVLIAWAYWLTRPRRIES